MKRIMSYFRNIRFHIFVCLRVTSDLVSSFEKKTSFTSSSRVHNASFLTLWITIQRSNHFLARPTRANTSRSIWLSKRDTFLFFDSYLRGEHKEYTQRCARHLHHLDESEIEFGVRYVFQPPGRRSLRMLAVYTRLYVKVALYHNFSASFTIYLLCALITYVFDSPRHHRTRVNPLDYSRYRSSPSENS